MNFDYLRLNNQDVSFIQHDEKYIKSGLYNKAIRRIFYNVNFDEFERQYIYLLQEKVKNSKLQIINRLRNDQEFLKFIYCSKFDVEKAFERLKNHSEWLSQIENKELEEESMNLLKKGIIYIAGRDKHLRPVVVINVHKLNMKTVKVEVFTNALIHIMRLCQNYMYYPGAVENTVFLIEMDEMSMFDFPFKALKSIIETSSKYFPHTLEKVCVMNPSFSLFLVWKIIDAFIAEESKSKIKFIKKSDITHLHEYISEINLEEKYGGKLKNFESHWPPLQITKEDIKNYEFNEKSYKMAHINLNTLKYKWILRLSFYLKRFMFRF